MRLTLAELKLRANWADVLNICVTDARFLIYLNEALQRLMNAGLWVGMTQKYQFCTNCACVTVPRFFETFEVVDVCTQPYTVRNQWYEFLDNGPGLLGDCGCYTPRAVVDQGPNYAMIDDLRFIAKLRFTLTNPDDAGKTITIRGYDYAGAWVLTGADGTTNGEIVTLAYPHVDCVTSWGAQVFREVLKDATKGFVKVEAYDASANPLDPDLALVTLAYYEPSETLPEYRRYFIPALTHLSGGCNCSNTGATTTTPPTVTVIAKLRFIPIESDTDFIPLANLTALKLAMRAVMLEERGDYAGARTCMYGSWDAVQRKFVNGAIPALDDELDSYQGAGTVAPLRLRASNIDRAGVYNMI